jgi:hypothetical protein
MSNWVRICLTRSGYVRFQTKIRLGLTDSDMSDWGLDMSGFYCEKNVVFSDMSRFSPDTSGSYSL